MYSVIIRAFNLFLFYVEMLAAVFLIYRKRTHVRLWVLRLAVCSGVIFGVCTGLCYLDDFFFSLINTASFSYGYFLYTYSMAVFMQLFVFALFGATLVISFGTSTIETISLGCAAFSMQNVSRCLFTVYRMASGGDSLYPVKSFSEPINIVAYLLIYAAVYIAMWLLFIRKRENSFTDNLNNKILAVLVVIILVNVVIGCVNAPKDSEQAYILFCFILIARMLLCLLGLVLQFYLSDWVTLQLRQEQMQQIMEQQKEQYEIAKENIDTVNVNAHDLRNQMAVLRQAINDTGGNAAVIDELTKMEKSVGIVDTLYRTGNRALDITLTEKARICADKHVNLSAIADGGSISFMSDVDIYSLFGCALDNSVEAVEKIEDEENRIIIFSLIRKDGVVSVHIENTVSESPNFQDGIPQTNKKDKRFHGYGVRSIIRIAERYGGNVRMRAENGMFYTDILFAAQSGN
ncbi:MAG: ATP-binding protein [Candidatus Coproplasma sp.]